jgi:hypothetical protein
MSTSYVWHCPSCTRRNTITLSGDENDAEWVHCPECQGETRLSVIKSGNLRELGGAVQRLWVLPLAAGIVAWLILRFALQWTGVGLWIGTLAVVAIVFGINQEKQRG